MCISLGISYYMVSVLYPFFSSNSCFQFMQFKEVYSFFMIVGIIYLVVLPAFILVAYMNDTVFENCCGENQQTEEEAKSDLRHIEIIFVLGGTMIIL